MFSLEDMVMIIISALKFKAAEQWCSLGMRFLKHLTQHKTTYEDQVYLCSLQ